MDAIRKKLAVAYFGDEGLHASPIIDLLMKIVQMLLTGGICPTPARALAWAKRHQRLTNAKAYWYAIQVTDDSEESTRVADAISKVITDATDEEATAVATGASTESPPIPA